MLFILCYFLHPGPFQKLVLFGAAHEFTHGVPGLHAVIENLVDALADGHLHALVLGELMDTLGGVISFHHGAHLVHGLLNRFALTDQNGAEHKLADYRGKVIFLNFWATWCGPCQREMPDIQKLYEKYGKNTGDVIVLGVANPKTKDAPNNQDQAEPGIVQYLSENGYSYPVLMDRTGALFSAYGITSFPTTFMIDQEGNVFGYVTGMLTADIMESIVRQTLEGRRP